MHIDSIVVHVPMKSIVKKMAMNAGSVEQESKFERFPIEFVEP